MGAPNLPQVKQPFLRPSPPASNNPSFDRPRSPLSRPTHTHRPTDGLGDSSTPLALTLAVYAECLILKYRINELPSRAESYLARLDDSAYASVCRCMLCHCKMTAGHSYSLHGPIAMLRLFCYIFAHEFLFNPQFDLEPDHIIRKGIRHRIQRCNLHREILSTFHTSMSRLSISTPFLQCIHPQTAPSPSTITTKI